MLMHSRILKDGSTLVSKRRVTRTQPHFQRECLTLPTRPQQSALPPWTTEATKMPPDRSSSSSSPSGLRSSTEYREHPGGTCAAAPGTATEGGLRRRCRRSGGLSMYASACHPRLCSMTARELPGRLPGWRCEGQKTVAQRDFDFVLQWGLMGQSRQCTSKVRAGAPKAHGGETRSHHASLHFKRTGGIRHHGSSKAPSSRMQS